MYKNKPKLKRGKKINWSKAIHNVNLENRKKEICELNKVPELREDNFAEQLEIQHELKGWELEQSIQWKIASMKRDRKEKDKKIKKEKRKKLNHVSKLKLRKIDEMCYNVKNNLLVI